MGFSMSSNENLVQRRQAAVAKGVAIATPVFAERARNAELWDIEGNRYVDFAAGIAVLNVGHQHPEVVAAVQGQLERFAHTAFQVMAYEPYVALAERLNAIAPFAETAKSVLFTTGAEATENAAKIARAATGRSGIISFVGGFHGRSALAGAMTGKVRPYKHAFGPTLPDVFHVPFPSPESGITVEQSLNAIDFLFAADLDPSRVAAIIIEPVQGEGGFHVASAELMQGLRAICDEHGILLIADEVQTGFARTGRMFAVEHSGVEPDLVTVAKALGGGFPISGVIGRAPLMDSIEPGGMGGTYGGPPIGCVAALAVLDVIERENLTARSNEIGDRLRARISGWQRRNDLLQVSEPRGLGAMVGFDILDSSSGKILPGAAKQVCSAALNHGVVVLPCGQHGETVRILTPLTAEDDLLDEGLDGIEAALRELL